MAILFDVKKSKGCHSRVSNRYCYQLSYVSSTSNESGLSYSSTGKSGKSRKAGRNNSILSDATETLQWCAKKQELRTLQNTCGRTKKAATVLDLYGTLFSIFEMIFLKQFSKKKYSSPGIKKYPITQKSISKPINNVSSFLPCILAACQ